MPSRYLKFNFLCFHSFLSSRSSSQSTKESPSIIALLLDKYILEAETETLREDLFAIKTRSRPLIHLNFLISDVFQRMRTAKDSIKRNVKKNHLSDITGQIHREARSMGKSIYSA